MAFRTVVDTIASPGGIGTAITTPAAFKSITLVRANIGTNFGVGSYGLDVFINGTWYPNLIPAGSPGDQGVDPVSPVNGNTLYCQGVRFNASYAGTASVVVQLIVED